MALDVIFRHSNSKIKILVEQYTDTPEEFSSLVSNFSFKSAIKLEKDDWFVTARATVLAVPRHANLTPAAALLSHSESNWALNSARLFLTTPPRNKQPNNMCIRPPELVFPVVIFASGVTGCW
jgi:hypothetical protein